MATPLTPAQHRLLREALGQLRGELNRGLSARQARAVARIDRNLSKLLSGHPAPRPASQDANARTNDALQSALGRLDACLDERLRRRVLDPVSRHSLCAELQAMSHSLGQTPPSGGVSDVVS